MVVIGAVMAVAMHRPRKIFLEPVGMTVLDDHLHVLLKRLEDRRGMGRCRHDGPYHHRKAEKRREHAPSDCPDRDHRSCLLLRLVQRVSRCLALSSPGG